MKNMKSLVPTHDINIGDPINNIFQIPKKMPETSFIFTLLTNTMQLYVHPSYRPQSRRPGD